MTTVAFRFDRVAGVRLSEAQVERLLRNVTAPASPSLREEGAEEEFRISIAGARSQARRLRQ